MWRLRRGFWNWLVVRKFRANRPQAIPVPGVGRAPTIRTIPLRDRYPGIPIVKILVADHVPADENRKARLLFIRVQTVLYRVFPPSRPGLRQISPDPAQAMASAYGRGPRRVLPAPVLPAEYQGEIDLGHLAVAGPYSSYLRAVPGPDGGTDPSPSPSYEWDFSHLSRYEHHRDLRSLGVRVRFEIDDDRRGVSPVEIDCELGVVTPDDATWADARRLALCAATNHLSLVRHFTWVHLATAAQSAVATRNSLPPGHRLRRLLWPHVWGTQYSNELVMEVMLMKGGDFESVFSFTHEGMCRLLEDSYELYDVSTFDPYADVEQRGLVGAPFDLPSFENRRAHFDVMHAHARRYLHGCYRSDEEIRADADVVAWVADLNRRLPGGVDRVVGEALTVDGVARLVAILLHVGTVEHEVMGSGLWNYQVWTHVQPVRVRKNGGRDPLDVYQRLVNFNFVLNVRRAPLLQDLSYLAVDEAGAAAFRTFRADLDELQATVAKEDPACWRMSPAILEVSVNG
ncbi:MAG: arachidonate 15-lipoxygenase [Actinomycetota bacterium]|jgi:arachidonate 15-lipoxygenase|nr:arachidonate 15-lipoxygenase [Actinomycetota bacterium]